MRGDDVPEQHAVREPELGEHAVDDRGRRLGGPSARQLPLGREGDAGDAGAAVPRSLADEHERRVAAGIEIRLQPLAEQTPRLGTG